MSHARQPTGVERHFAAGEVIVTKTDPRGRITYANDVFCRVSALSHDDVIGQPHNVIRHPDMPRGVFKLMWDTISAGGDFLGFVLNLAADGGHYWVNARVSATRDEAGAIIGYHSSRWHANDVAVAAVVPLYQRMRDAEARLDAATAAAAAGLEVLRSEIPDYDTFVWSLALEDA